MTLIGIKHHSALPGLLLDTHTQYLLANGSRAMTDDLDMDMNNIIDIGDIDCVTATVSSGLITGANGETLGIGVIDRVMDFAVDGAVVANLQFTNDNGPVGMLALSADATVIEIARAASTDIYCFHLASDENPMLRIYGDTIGGPNYGYFQFESGSDFAIGTDVYDLVLKPASESTHIVGDLGVSGSITASEYLGGSDIHLREDAITFGCEDTATMSIVAGTVWTLNTDNVFITQLTLKSETIWFDAEENDGTPTIKNSADEFSVLRKADQRPMIETSYDNAWIKFAGHTFATQTATPALFMNKYEDEYIVKVDGFNGIVELTGAILLDPTDGGHWPSAKVVIKGDTYWEDEGSGLPFGSFKGNEIAWTQAAAQNVWYTISHAGISAGQTNNTTFQNNQEILITIAGKYFVNYYLSMTCSIANKHILSAPEINSAEQLDGQSHYDFPAANTEESWSGSAILDLAANDVVSIGVATDDTGSPTLTVQHVGLTLVQIGGT